MQFRVLQASIVCEAYDHQGYWADALYTHVVQGGNLKYLTDFKNHYVLTSALISDLTHR